MAVITSYADTLTDSLRAIFDERYADALVGDAPGGSVLITKGDSVIFEYYAGLADMVSKKPIGPETTFCIASVSKQFTVAGLMRLAEKGLVDMDAPPDTLVRLQGPVLGRCHSASPRLTVFRHT